MIQMDKTDKEAKKKEILLITNRDSDNVGDQLIEINNISLIHTVMKNLGYDQKDYVLFSRAAGIISRRYMKTENEDFLLKARKAIGSADLVIFGGAPMFNYAYQNFYKRTIISIKLAEEYKVPILFSSIGIEKYDEADQKCQSLKAALNESCVKLITTRDDLDSLRNYVTNEEILTARVSDPAVFSDIVVKKCQNQKKQKAMIGLVVVRGGIFKDNQISFSEEDQTKFWFDLVDRLTGLGYDYEFLSTGHFSDEAFLDKLCRERKVPISKFIFNINTPEDLIDRISSYDGLIAYRLHAGIAAYTYNVPSIGLIWNQKISFFYDIIGHPERAFECNDWNAETVVTALQKAMKEGISKDNDYIMSIYDTLFVSMKKLFRPEEKIIKYTYKDLIDNIHIFEGTSDEEKWFKLRRKFRRTYENYNLLETMLEKEKTKSFSQKLKAILKPNH